MYGRRDRRLRHACLAGDLANRQPADFECPLKIGTGDDPGNHAGPRSPARYRMPSIMGRFAYTQITPGPSARWLLPGVAPVGSKVTSPGIIRGMVRAFPIRRHARFFLVAVGIYWATWPVLVASAPLRMPAYVAGLFVPGLLLGAAAVILYFWYWRRVLGRGQRFLWLYWETDFRAWVYFWMPPRWARIIRTAEWPVLPIAALLVFLLVVDLIVFIKFG